MKGDLIYNSRNYISLLDTEYNKAYEISTTVEIISVSQTNIFLVLTFVIYNSRNYISLLDQYHYQALYRIYNSRNYISLLDGLTSNLYLLIYNSRNYISLLDTQAVHDFAFHLQQQKLYQSLRRVKKTVDIILSTTVEIISVSQTRYAIQITPISTTVEIISVSQTPVRMLLRWLASTTVEIISVSQTACLFCLINGSTTVEIISVSQTRNAHRSLCQIYNSRNYISLLDYLS